MVYLTNLKDFNLLIATVNIKDPEDILKKKNDDIIILLDLNSVVDIEHIEEIVKQVLEAHKRGVMIAEHVEIETILRVACTNQISKAMKFASAKRDSKAVLVILSKKEIDTGSLKLEDLEYSKERSEALIMYHNIGKDELYAMNNRLSLLLAEKANLIY
ncbi:MAG: KEOPS complex subunit Cgi121 [Candidatus Nitrosocaldaceae archaeon]